MLVSVKWLKDYVDIEVPVDEFADRMILSGSNIETVEPYGTKFSKIVVGKILKIEKHPDAEKLVVCSLDIGESNPIQIVTGAKNVFEGAVVPAILHGGKLPDGTTIKKSKLRGVESDGMLCSAAEMGYEDKVIDVNIKDGIWILDESFKPGTPIEEALGLLDHVIDFEITPNRPDCLSMIGMAREASAVFGVPLRYPAVGAEHEEGDASEYVQVEVKNNDLCKRYTARVIKDVKVGASPWWMQKRLMHAGMRPINNIVDITNFVMLEYGQPLHAFDIRDIAGNKIVVDTAKNDEVFTTLDGAERKLSEDILMISDAEKHIGIAGIMGGLNSEIREDTSVVVLESANFNMDSIRSSSKQLALRTEASGRFEKGIDANLCSEAADRVCRLIEELGCGTVVGGMIDIYPEKQNAKPVAVRVPRINAVLGTNLSEEYMVNIFKSLEMNVETDGNGNLTVTPPTVRQDLLEEVDFVEEVARLYGYDKMETTLPANENVAKLTPMEEKRRKAREILTAMGLNEVLTYSFVNPKSVDKIGISDTDISKRNFVKIINPLGEDNSVMRTMLTPSMMDVLARNYAMGNKNISFFEIGRVFNNEPINCDGQPVEAEGLCIGMYGENVDFYTLKGVIDGLLELLGVENRRYTAESRLGMYHPGRCANLISEPAMLGTVGQIHPDVAEKYGIDVPVYTCELLFSTIAALMNTVTIYKPLPKYPAITRDIAFVVEDSMQVGDIIDVIKDVGSKLLENVELFDVYRGQQIEEGKKSVAFALRYRDSQKTLTDEEVTKIHSKILKALEERLGILLREV